MDKTISINLGGTLFQIDEEAYKMLRNYLQSIDMKFRNTPGGNETIEDIEIRIAEIFQSRKGSAGIISTENVVDMIRIIGKPEDFDEAEPGAAASNNSYWQSGFRKKLYRNPENRIIGGVCGGVGAFINTDPVWIRILFVVFACFFGIGLFIYLALWLALPSAATDSQKREMYGSMSNQAKPGQSFNSAGNSVGRAFDAVFQALGKVFYIIIRIFLIITGVCLVVGGFLALLSFVMVTLFKYPGAFSTNMTGITLSYLPDFLNYVITPSAVPWVKALIALTVTIPLLALIYGGVRMIFWFRARDGFIWLGAFVLWIMSAAALSIIMFNEGIGFAEKGRTRTQIYLDEVPDTLFIKTGMKISDLKYDKEFVLPDEEYDSFYISDEKKEIYFRTSIDLEHSQGSKAGLEITKSSAGRSRLDAQRKSERLIYNANVSGNTIVLDEFFTIPPDTKWSFDFVSVDIFVPEGTVISMDKTAEYLFHHYHDDDFTADPLKKYWFMTEEGPELVERHNN